jgi:hypothetical protein
MKTPVRNKDLVAALQDPATAEKNDAVGLKSICDNEFAGTAFFVDTRDSVPVDLSFDHIHATTRGVPRAKQWQDVMSGLGI